MTGSEAAKIWANSGDSHLVEPPDLFSANLPADLAERMPRAVKDPDGEYETVYIDGQSFRRKLPKLETIMKNMARPDDDTSDMFSRAPGSNDPNLRLQDSDQEGIWAEVIYPSLGIWAFNSAEWVIAVVHVLFTHPSELIESNRA